ncbi:MAG TPA: tetratricopeptide repeat protein [Vicinamibacterales bacterium]
MASAFSRKELLSRAAVIVLAGLFAYANSLSGPFLFDDESSIVGNRSIRDVGSSLSPPRETPVAGRPLVNLTFALNYAFGGLDVRGYHLVNIAIHVAAALVLFGIVRRTLLLPQLARRFGTASADVALGCGLIWMLHPLQTEAVNYLSERTESLMGLFYLLTLYSSIRGSDADRRSNRGLTPRRWRGAAIAACAAGMACKESMVTAPVMVVMYDRVFLFDGFRAAFRARRGFYAGLFASWLVLAALMAATPRTSVGFGAGTSPWVYLLNQAELLARYLWLSAWPRELVLDYGLPRSLTLGDAIVPGALVVALIAATAVALRYAPTIGFLGAWFFLTLAPTSSIVPIATEVGAERRMYLPLAGIVALGVVGLWRVLSRGPQGSAPRHRSFVAVATAVCILLGAGTILRNQEYQSRLAIARTIVERRPHGRAHFLLANELIGAGQRDEAMAQLRLSARDYPGAHFALGTELLGEGRTDEAIAEIETFLRALPAHANAVPARDMLGRAYLAQGKFPQAAEQFRYLHEKAPSYRGAGNDILLNLGYALVGSGRLLEAVPVLERAAESSPNDAAVRDLLSRVRAASGVPPLTNRPN